MAFERPRTAALVAVIVLTATASHSNAHEFWISPHAGKVMPGETISADLKVGLMLKGETYPYLSSRFRSFGVTVRGKYRHVVATEGDLPALAALPTQSGLQVITHETIAFRANHEDWPTFQRYLREEGLSDFEQDHLNRGLPKAGFAERYTRYAKALIQAGPVGKNDRDAQTGMALELTAGSNPYVQGLSELPVTLTWKGAALAGRQINVFHDNEGTISRTTLFTDASGRIKVTLKGAGEYLLSAVHLEPADSSPVVWESHWATLSFRL